MPISTHSHNFRIGLSSIVRGDKLIAPFRAFLQDPNFEDFDIHVSGIGHRAPDYYFHPSQHPSWAERALFLWMVSPDLLIGELQNPTAVMSMTAGSIWHSIVGYAMVKLGLVHSLERPYIDELHRTRGKVDGVLGADEELWELKSMKDQRLQKIKTVDDYLKANPTYNLQANEYMRISGIHKERVLLMSLTFPFDMREFVIEYDHVLGREVAEKYERVLQAVADGKLPMCCGENQGTTCPARGICQGELRKP